MHVSSTCKNSSVVPRSARHRELDCNNVPPMPGRDECNEQLRQHAQEAIQWLNVMIACAEKAKTALEAIATPVK